MEISSYNYDFKIILSDEDKKTLKQSNTTISSYNKTFNVDDALSIIDENESGCIPYEKHLNDSMGFRHTCWSLMAVTCGSRYVGWIFFHLEDNSRTQHPKVYIHERESWGTYNSLKKDVSKCMDTNNVDGEKSLSVGRYIWYALLDYIKNTIYPDYNYIFIFNNSLDEALEYHKKNGMRLIQTDKRKILGLKTVESVIELSLDSDASDVSDASDATIIRIPTNKLHYILFGVSKTIDMFGHNNIISGMTICNDGNCGMYVNFNTSYGKIIWYDCSSRSSKGRKMYKSLLEIQKQRVVEFNAIQKRIDLLSGNTAYMKTNKKKTNKKKNNKKKNNKKKNNKKRNHTKTKNKNKKKSNHTNTKKKTKTK